MTAPARSPRSAFETEPCPRCGGSGTRSHCQTWGTTCFQCGTRPGVPGSGYRLTKRGRAARDYCLSLFPAKRARDLEPGEVIEVSGWGWLTVSEVRPTTTERHDLQGRDTAAGCLDVHTARVLLAGVSPDSAYKLRPTPEQRQAARDRALAYQATLTKTGKPAKRPRPAPAELVLP